MIYNYNFIYIILLLRFKLSFLQLNFCLSNNFLLFLHWWLNHSKMTCKRNNFQMLCQLYKTPNSAWNRNHLFPQTFASATNAFEPVRFWVYISLIYICWILFWIFSMNQVFRDIMGEEDENRMVLIQNDKNGRDDDCE